MSNIIETARHMNKLKAEFGMALSLGLPEPVHINLLLKKLNIVVNNLNEEKPQGMDELWRKVKHAYNEKEMNLFEIKDIKKFPFLLNQASRYNSALCKALMAIIKRTDSMQLLRREIHHYFNEYGNDAYIAELRNDILRKLKNYNNHNQFLLSLKQHLYLFNAAGIRSVCDRCVEENIFDYFYALHFPKSLLHSNYVCEVIKGIFSSSYTQLSLESKIELFEKFYEKFEDEFSDFLPYIFSSLILQTDKCDNGYRDSFIERIRPRALSFMGDPRLGSGNYGRWNVAGEHASAIFITWLSQYDLDAFFKIIGNSLVDFTARNMWMYREQFWKSYKKQIQMVWVCYGANAISTAKRSKMSCGKYSGFGDGTKSCILIVIGDYMFVERSHNGTLKVWKKKLSPFKIGELNISESRLNNSAGITHLENGIPKDGWVHSSSYSYNWQKKVGSFIAQYMNVVKKERDWRV